PVDESNRPQPQLYALTGWWAISWLKRSIHLGLVHRQAVGMRGVDAEDLHLAGEEAKLVERELHGPVLRMALDVGVELRGGEAAAQHVALELRHVDAVGGEAAHGLVERRRHVPHAENEGGDDEPAVVRRDARALGHDEEARGVVAGVLDVLLERDEAVDLSRQLR